MTPGEVREALADAANAVADVSASPRFRTFLEPGDASVRLAGVARSENGFGWVATWQLWVLLPQDLGDAENYMDDRAMALAAALDSPELLTVTSVTGQQLNVGSGPLPCLVIEGHREQE